MNTNSDFDYNYDNPQFNQTPATPVFPMKWHKFLIYFSLWLSALVSLGNVGMYFGGLHYGDSAGLVYAVYPGMSILDKVMGVVCLAIMVYTIMTRFALAGYRTKGPRMLGGVYAANAVIAVVYAVLASVVSGLPLGDMLDSSSIGSLVGSVAMIFINRDYYAKRAVLFNR